MVHTELGKIQGLFKYITEKNGYFKDKKFVIDIQQNIQYKYVPNVQNSSVEILYQECYTIILHYTVIPSVP